MNLDKTLAALAADPAAPFDVAELALALARDEYPELDAEAYLAELTAMAHEIRGRLRGTLESRVRRFTRHVFHDLGFHGNAEDYYDPRNSYLNDVIDRRTGLPITLSAVAMSIGQRAGLEIAGVGLPGHFIAKAVAGARAVLFDPFHGGRLLSPADCEQLVEAVTGQPFKATADALAPIALGPMAVRMLTNLKAVYLGRSDFRRAVRVMERLRQLCPSDALQRRDLGAALLRGGEPGRAIAHLQAYLTNAPEADDASAVRDLLNKAQGAIAAWN
jgi:regulator of sirC expression with transglutaminase-like and TPR domain